MAAHTGITKEIAITTVFFWVRQLVIQNKCTPEYAQHILQCTKIISTSEEGEGAKATTSPPSKQKRKDDFNNGKVSMHKCDPEIVRGIFQESDSWDVFRQSCIAKGIIFYRHNEEVH